jgi:uncharacterized protein (DUF169 family)
MRATDNSIGKLRLNATLDIVVGTGMRSTAAMAAIHTRISQSLNCEGSRQADRAMNHRIGRVTASS